MRKFTLLIALLACSIGFSQSSVSSYAEQNGTVYSPQQGATNQNVSSDGTAATFDATATAIQEQNQVLIVNSGTPNYYLTGVFTYSEYVEGGNTLSVASDRPTVVVEGNRSSGVVDTYTDLATFQANVGGTLVSEDFSGGPGGVTTCGMTISSAGDACFPAGEIEEGFNVMASNGTDTVLLDIGIIGNTIFMVGANTFAEYTIINFTGPDPVFEVGHVIINNLDPDTDYRIFDTGGALIQSFNLNNAVGTENFFGIISPLAIGSIEIEGLNASGELFGNLLFTAPGGGGGGGVCPAPVLEVNQDITNTCMANISQTDLAQSYMAVEPISAGAGVEFQGLSTGLDVTLSLWDALPNAGGTMLASGTSQTDGVNLFTDVFWDPVVNVTPGDTYYIVIDGDLSLPCVSGNTADPYPGGNVFANAGFTPFPTFDYTFRTYSCAGGGGGGGCTAGVYTDRASFNAESGVLTLEDFDGGPGGISMCGVIIDSTGDGTCYAPGEIQPGIQITSTNGAGGQTVYAEAGNFGLPNDAVGSNTFTDFTIINFPNMDVNSFGFDLYGLIGGATMDIRIFGVGGLIDTQTVTALDPAGVFFGYIASETVVGLEIEDLSGGTAELVAQFEFGECTTSAACIDVTYVAGNLPADIDPGGTSTVDCVGAPNLYPVTVNGVGTIGTDSNIDNVSLTILHTFDGDLDISLVAPSGTELLLSGGNGGGGNDFIDTVFMDGAGPLSGGAPPYTGTFEPDGGTFAAAFAGEAITGDWNLKICDNFGGDTGTVEIFDLTICSPPLPDNDLCADAFPIACGDVVVSETTTNTDTGGNPAPDEWYSFTGTGTPQVVTLSLCDGGTDYDSFLRVYDACGGTEIAANDDSCGLQSELSFLSDGTTTYYIMVEGFASNSGNFSLEVTCVDPPPNDECAGAISMSCGDTVVGETDTATFDASAPVCVTGITAPGVWYEFTDTTGLVTNYTLSMCDGGTDYDSKITVYSGDCGALACVVDNDDTCGLQSEVSWQGDGLTTYYILVHGFGANTGNFSMALTCAPVPPPNDMIANSIDVDEIGFPYTDPAVAMPAATTEAGTSGWM